MNNEEAAKKQKNILNRNFDDLRLSSLWSLEEILERKEEFFPIFKNRETYQETMEELKKIIETLKTKI